MEIPLKVLSDYLSDSGFVGNKAIAVIKIDEKLYHVNTSYQMVSDDISVIIDIWTKRQSGDRMVGVVISARYKYVIHDKVYNLSIESLYEIEEVIKKYIYLNGESIRSIVREFNLSRILETST